MSWIRIWVHLVFSTKNWEPMLTKEIRNELYRHMHANANQKNIWLDCAGGYSDHAHCIISLGREQTISKVAQLIKGESSYWLNKTYFGLSKFHWQDDFWATGISESHLQRVRDYISNQEKHHRKLTFKEEVNEFIKEYGWNKIYNRQQAE
jgi:putative transposase